MVTEQFVLHGINTPSGFLSQISSGSVNPEMQIVRGKPAGLPGSRFIYNGAQVPAFRFNCEQLKSILDICGCGLADLTSGNTDLYFKKTANRASRVADATTQHIRCRAPKAVLVPLSLRATLGSPATLSARIVCTWDGTNEPLTPAGGVALAGTPVSCEEQFVVGPVAINGSTISGIQETEIDFGVALFEQMSDGELYLTFIAEQERQPMVTFKTLTASLPSIGLNGSALTSGSFYFRKCGQTARVPNATAEHLKFSATSGLVHIVDQTGGGNEASLTTIRCELSMPDATTAPLTVDTTSAIE